MDAEFPDRGVHYKVLFENTLKVPIKAAPLPTIQVLIQTVPRLLVLRNKQSVKMQKQSLQLGLEFSLKTFMV